MSLTEDRIQTQLTLLGDTIEELGAKIRARGDESDLDVLEYFAELKALLACAFTRVDDFRASTRANRARLESEMKSAYRDLTETLGPLNY